MKKGDTIFLIFNKKGEVVLDSHGQPRIYTSLLSVKRFFPESLDKRKYNLVEYGEIKNASLS